MDKSAALADLAQRTVSMDPSLRSSLMLAAYSFADAAGIGQDCEISYSFTEEFASLSMRNVKPETDEAHVQIPALPIDRTELSSIQGALKRFIQRFVWLTQMQPDSDECTLLAQEGNLLVSRMLEYFSGDTAAAAEKLPVREVIPDISTEPRV